MSHQDLQYRVDEKVATTALNRPERMNALSRNPEAEIQRAFDEVLGLQASGVHAALLLEGALRALVHSSHNEDRERLFEAQRQRGLKAYLQIRDGPFQPEPTGPRSKPRQSTERTTSMAKPGFHLIRIFIQHPLHFRSGGSQWLA